MKSSSLGKRLRVLEQQAAEARTINAYTAVDKSLADWTVLENTITAEELCALADNLRAEPLASNSPEMLEFASASGHSPEQCSEIISQALTHKFEALYWTKTHWGGRTV